MKTIERFVLFAASPLGEESIAAVTAEYQLGDGALCSNEQPVRQFRVEPQDGESFQELWERALEQAKADEGI